MPKKTTWQLQSRPSRNNCRYPRSLTMDLHEHPNKNRDIKMNRPNSICSIEMHISRDRSGNLWWMESSQIFSWMNRHKFYQSLWPWRLNRGSRDCLLLKGIIQMKKPSWSKMRPPLNRLQWGIQLKTKMLRHFISQRRRGCMKLTKKDLEESKSKGVVCKSSIIRYQKVPFNEAYFT